MDEQNQKQRAELKKQHERTKRTLKIVGVLIAVAGLGLAVIGLVDMVSSASAGCSV